MSQNGANILKAYEIYEFLKYDTYLVLKIAKYNGASVCICMMMEVCKCVCRRIFGTCNFVTCSSQFVLQRNILHMLPVLPYFSTQDS